MFRSYFWSAMNVRFRLSELFVIYPIYLITVWELFLLHLKCPSNNFGTIFDRSWVIELFVVHPCLQNHLQIANKRIFCTKMKEEDQKPISALKTMYKVSGCNKSWYKCLKSRFLCDGSQFFRWGWGCSFFKGSRSPILGFTFQRWAAYENWETYQIFL